MKTLVFKNNSAITTNSLLVAEVFEKNHRDVLDSIRTLLSSAENPAVLSMFIESSYIASNGKENPMYIMTRDGFSLLAMGFTGQKALNFKLDFINAFNQMENSLKSLDFSNPDTILMLAQNWKEEQVKRIRLEKENAILKPKADLMDKVLDTDEKIDVGQVAKILELPFGRNTLFKKLRELGVFFKNRNEPKQEYIGRGYFQLKEKWIERNTHDSFMVVKVLVTQKGLAYISSLFDSSPESKLMAKMA